MKLFGGYDRPGPGIPKAPMEKKGWIKCVEVYGRRMWKLMALNLLFILSCLPVVTIGPAIAAMTKVCRNWSQERNAFLWEDYWEAFKKNFKQSFIMGLIDVLFLVSLSVAIPTYNEWAKNSNLMFIPFLLCLSCAIVFFMMHFYIYLMIVSTNLSMRQIIKNSFLLVSLGMKSSLWTLLVWIMVLFTMFILLPMSLIIVLFWPFSFLCFVSSFNCYPVVRKYVIQPYYDKRGEDNPEFDYLKTEDVAIFEDRGAEEPANKAEKPAKKKGKIIS
ncbi:MAG: DUF624 domain-containing protein [Ruminococcus sp.]|nr:DUF624 domain-containing protein [Ruminococcus sp.]